MFWIAREFELDANQSILGRSDDVTRSVEVDEARHSFLLPLPLLTSTANVAVVNFRFRTEYPHEEV